MISFEVSKFQNSKIPNKEWMKMKKEKFSNNNQQHIELGELYIFPFLSSVLLEHIVRSMCIFMCVIVCIPTQTNLFAFQYLSHHVVWCQWHCLSVFFWISCSMTYATKEKKSIRQFYVSNSVYAAEKCTTVSSILMKVKSSRNNRKWESTRPMYLAPL